MKSLLLIFSTFVFLAFACSQGFEESNAIKDMSKELSRASETIESQKQVSDVEQTNRKLIKNGTILFETKNIDESKAYILNLIKEYNGYVANQSQNDYSERLNYSINARVPAEQFDLFFQTILNHAHRIENQQIEVRDVTQEYIDVEARINTKKELESRYVNLLNKANSVEEILSIERELGTLRSDIESMEGQLNYLKNQTSYSTVNIRFYKRTTSDFGFGSKLISAFADGWKSLLAFIIGLVHLWPFFILLALLIYLLRKFSIFKRNNKIG